MLLAYIGGVLVGKRNVQAWSRKKATRSILSADIALAEAGLGQLKIEPQEGLAIVEGTASSCAIAVLVIYDAHMLAIMAEILTAMSLEALRGTDKYSHPFIAEVRPHSRQVSKSATHLNSLMVFLG